MTRKITLADLVSDFVDFEEEEGLTINTREAFAAEWSHYLDILSGPVKAIKAAKTALDAAAAEYIAVTGKAL